MRILFIVFSPINSQNDRVYAPLATKKRDISANRLLRTRSTFSKSVMVSFAVSIRNWAVPTSFLLNMDQTSTGKTCC